jgi:RHS repeat-associated protein
VGSIKKLGLGVLIAALLSALTNVATTSASPYGFVAESYPQGGVTLKGVSIGSGVESRLYAFGYGLHCKPGGFYSTVQSRPSSAVQEAGSSSPQLCGEGGEGLSMNGCHFGFTAVPPASLPEEMLAGAVEIECPEGNAIEVEDLIQTCDATIEPSADFVGRVDYVDLGNGSVRFDAEMENLKVALIGEEGGEGGGAFCQKVTATASWYPKWSVTAENQLGQPVSLKYAELPLGLYLSAGKAFEAENYPRALSGAGFTFKGAGATVTCGYSSLTDSLTSSVGQLTLDANHENCVAAGRKTTVDMRSCHYALTGGGVFSIACSKEGDKIEYKAYNEDGSLWCTAKVGPQSGLNSVSLENIGSGKDRRVAMNANVVGISWERTGTGTCTTTSGSGGTMTGESVLTGTADPPNTVISSGPAETIYLPEAGFEFASTAPESSFQCALDIGSFIDCSSQTAVYTNLSEGAHTFRVRSLYVPGNRDATPAERTFEVGPNTSIDAPKPTYLSNESPGQVEFSANQPGATFKCSLDNPKEQGTEPCTAPFTLPEKPSGGWHTFVVQATGAKGIVDPTPAKWTFNTGIYPPAPSTSKLVYPEDGKKTASYYTLKAEWGSAPSGGGVTGVTFQVKLPKWKVDKPFETVPAECVIDDEGQQVSWPLEVTSNPGHTDPVYLKVRGCAPFANHYGEPFIGKKYPEEEIQFRAVFDGGKNAAGASEPVATEFIHSNKGTAVPTDAFATVGPASVDLLTGAFTVSRTDVSIPVPGTEANLEFTRVYNSSRPADESSGVGPMGWWQPSTPAEEGYEGSAWQKLEEQAIPAKPKVYDKECEEEWIEFEEEFDKEECLIEEARPEERWMELIDNEGAGIPFEIKGETYVSPDYAKELRLTPEKGSEGIVLADPSGTHTTFIKKGYGEYLPKAVSFQATPTSVRMVYENDSHNGLRLIRMIAPSPAGVECGDLTSIAKAGCRTLKFEYKEDCKWPGGGACQPQFRTLASIRYYNASGNTETSQKVAEYNYNSARLIEVWDPRLPELKEKYTYTEPYGSLLTSLTPPGEEAWNFDYEFGEYGLPSKLTSVSRATLTSPSTATTTIVYDVPVSGEDAPYDMSPSAVAEWGQTDFPVDATAIFPPTEVPSDPPSDYSEATIHYMDPDGYEVNTASPAPPGVEGDVISTSETDTRGNVIRRLSPQNRLLALANEHSVPRSKELDSHSSYEYGEAGARLIKSQSWGPLHKVRLESGETVEARAHTTIEYDQGFEHKEGETWPNLPTKETTAAAISWQPDKDASVTETKYNWELRKPIESIVDPGEGKLNLITKTDYNSAGQVKDERQPSGTEGGTTRTVYWTAGTNSENASCGNKKEWAGLPCVRHPLADPSPAESNPKLPWTWYTKYSNLDEPEETQEKTNGVLKRTTTVSYDSAGRPVKTKTTGPEGTLLPASETIYSSSTGAIEKQKRICETAEECGGSLDTQELKTTYDKLGRLTEYEDADGNVSEVAYDFMSRPVITFDGKGTQTITYDEDSGVATKLVDSAAGTFTTTYDAEGKVTEQILPNGLAQQITYDEAGTPTSLKYQKVSGCESGCTWLEFNRQFSIAGQVLKETGTLATKEYTYDKLGRLTLAKETPAGEGCTTRAYAFEGTAGKNSNRTAKTVRAPKGGGACDTTSAGTKTSYSYDTADRLIGEGVVYDSLGRITSLASKYSGGGTLATTYYVNDLTRSQTQDGLTNTYYLDAGLRQRERVQSGSKSGTEVYHYSTGSDSPSWTQEGANWTRNIAAMGGSLGALQKSSGEITFQLADMHGDVVGIAESSPSATKLKSTLAFDEFGNPKQGSTPKFGWLGASGRRTELPSGVIQMGLRSYVPALGRFLTMDPIRGGSANAYDYANQDPVNNFDLTGECAHRKKSCQRKEARKLKRRAHRKAKNRGMRRIAAASRGGGASASFVAPLPWDLFGADMREKVGGGAANVAVVVADTIFDRLKQGGIAFADTAVREVMKTLEMYRDIGSWVVAHRTQVEGCVSGAIAGAMRSTWLLSFGPPQGPVAMGLFVAASCGAGWLSAG